MFRLRALIITFFVKLLTRLEVKRIDECYGLAFGILFQFNPVYSLYPVTIQLISSLMNVDWSDKC